MKTSQLLNILLAAALVLLSVKLVRETPSEASAGDASEAAIENIMTRTSIRDY